MRTYLILPDLHAPYHDKRAWKLVLKVARYLSPHGLITLGDFGDFYSVSSHSKAPDKSSKLASELLHVQACREELDALNAKHKVFLHGNHEYRLDRYLADKAAALSGLISVESALQLKEHGWQTVPYKQSVRIGDVLFTHDLGKCGKYALHQALTDVGTSVVMGHIHRVDYCVEGTSDGCSREALSPGWLGDITQADYMHRDRSAREWAHGFAVGYMDSKGRMRLQPVPISRDYSCLFDEKIWR